MTEDTRVVTVTEQVPVPTPVVQREVVVLPSERTVVVDSPVNQIVEIDKDTFIVESAPEINVVTVGEQGPRGLPGVAVDTITRVAATALSGNRVVVLNASEQAVYADNTDTAHADKILGVTTGAVNSGADATIQTYGEMVEPSFAFTPELAVYVSTNGLMTQTPPTSGFKRGIGFALAATKLFIDLREPVIRA